MIKHCIEENDLVEKFTIGSGRGGQKLHKTASCVVLKHVPTGIVVRCQKYRTREKNRVEARRLLSEKIEERFKRKKAEAQHLKEKMRRQKRGRSRAGQEDMLEEKRRRSFKKKMRKQPDVEG